MLAWRAVSSSTRGAVRPFRQNAPKSARLMHSTPLRLQYPSHPRPSGKIIPKIWFRPDGTPRSKFRGLMIGSISAVVLLLMYSMLDLIDEYDTVNYVLSCLVYVQRADAEYNIVDFTDLSSTRLYFYELCSAIPDTPKKVLDEFFEELTSISNSSRPETAEVHRLMRDASEKVHELVRRVEKGDAVDVGYDVLRELDRTIVALVELVEEILGEESADKRTIYLTLKERKAKDTPSRGTDYETIG